MWTPHFDVAAPAQVLIALSVCSTLRFALLKAAFHLAAVCSWPSNPPWCRWCPASVRSPVPYNQWFRDILSKSSFQFRWCHVVIQSGHLWRQSFSLRMRFWTFLRIGCCFWIWNVCGQSCSQRSFSWPSFLTLRPQFRSWSFLASFWLNCLGLPLSWPTCLAQLLAILFSIPLKPDCVQISSTWPGAAGFLPSFANLSFILFLV